MLDSITGTHIEKYTVKEKLPGRGRYAIVFLAEGEKEEKVAIKVLKPELVDKKEDRERFNTEKKALGALKRIPGVIEMKTSGYIQKEEKSEADRPYIILEYLDGKSVTDVIAGEYWDSGRKKGLNPYPEKEALEIGVKLATVLAEAEKRMILHGDVRTDHFFFRKNEKISDAKIIDWNYALMDKSPHNAEAGHETGGKLWGVSLRKDIYDFGVFLFALVTGLDATVDYTPVRPRPSKVSYMSDGSQATNENPPPVDFAFGKIKREYYTGQTREIFENCSSKNNGIYMKPDVKNIIEKCCNSPAGGNYASMEALLTDLKEALKKLEPTGSRGFGSGYPATRTGEAAPRAAEEVHATGDMVPPRRPTEHSAWIIFASILIAAIIMVIGLRSHRPVEKPAPGPSATITSFIEEAVYNPSPADLTSEGWHALGYKLYDAQQYPKAVDSFQKAVNRDSQNLKARFWLGKAYAANGEKDKAVEELTWLIYNSPDNPFARDAVNWLKQNEPENEKATRAIDFFEAQNGK
jgi:serine/threonine protein kinase